MQNQQTNLQLLVRQNKGRTEHQYYTTELSHRLKAVIGPDDVLDLEETDRIFSTYREQSRRSSKEIGFAFRKVWAYKPAIPWVELCRRIGERLRGQVAILFVGPYEYCGAVRVNADIVLNEVASLLEFDCDTVSLQSASGDSGLLVDLYEEDSAWMVELVAWEKWKTLAEEQVSVPAKDNP